MKQVICLSTSNWYPIPTRKQQVMSRLKNARVLYFEPPVTYLAPWKDPQARERLTAFKGDGEHITDNLTVYAMPPVLPLYNKKRFINKMNQRKLGHFVRSICEKHGFEKPLLWVYSPSYADIVKYIPHGGLVYDCVDRHSAYKGLIDPAVVDAMEAELAKQANVVFATAKGLHDTLKNVNEHSYFIPNGASFELFNKVATENDLPFPDKLFNIKSPIFGFVGALQECIDYSLIEYAAKQRPDWSFVFLGKKLPQADISQIEGLPNVHLLGLVPHKQLPDYIARFSVCLNLFRPGDLSRDVSPLKFYEYLATGKPIVSTPQPLQVLDYADAIFVAETPREFVAACQKALDESNRWSVTQRIAYGRAASWDSRVLEMERILAENNL